ncbi:MAG: sugar phosphate nucleotidyltransferase [archaeon]|jgi:choline kinase|nr:sugar phosphate nucleotidyltransferase [Candidatus ainarchaeum sp.]
MDSDSKKVFSIVYMVAGLSSRFGGKVKQFARVGKNGETLIEVSINQAISAGFNKIIFVVGEKTEKLFKEKFGVDYKGIPIFYAKQEFNPIQRDKPWGTCDAIVSAKKIINEKFVVCNGDDIYGKKSFKILFDYLSEEENCATLGFSLGKVIPKKGSVNRAIYSIDEKNNVKDLKEIIGIERENLKELNLTEETLCSMNIFALTPQVLNLLEEKLIEFKKNNVDDRKKECYLPVELSQLIKENKLILKLLETPEEWMGVTNPEDEEELKQKIALMN